MAKEALCKVVTDDLSIFAMFTLSNGALFLVSTVHKVSGSVQNRGRSSFHFLSIAMFPIPVSRFCPIISLSFSSTCGDCTYGTKEERFNADVKGATANNGENTTIKQYLRQHLYPVRACEAGWEGERALFPFLPKPLGLAPSVRAFHLLGRGRTDT